MKMYTVESGTVGWVRNSNGKECRFRTTKRNIFTEMINDPVAYHNGRNLAQPNTHSWSHGWAKLGKAVFQDEDNPQWFLIVPYSSVRVN